MKEGYNSKHQQVI